MAYYEGNQSVEGDSPHKGPVMWKVFPRHDNAIFWVVGFDQRGIYIDI